jgi:hypothetical protein
MADDYIATVAMHSDKWGTFLEPDPALVDVEDLHEVLNIPILSGHRAGLKGFTGRSPVFDNIASRIDTVALAYEDQCSANYYFDVFGLVERSRQELLRVVDVGPFMGGSSSVFAGCVEPMGLELDIVDVNQAYLQFTHERIRRLFPNAMPKIRMFFGDLPTYVRTVLITEPPTRAMIHHDGAHSFDQVVKDLSSLSYVSDRVHSLAIHDTYLRGDIKYLNFVDAAVHAVFGTGVRHEPLGAVYGPDAPVTSPDQWQGNYFLPGQPEGMFIPFAGLKFRYPHPSMTLESFLPVKGDPAG